MPRIFYSLLSYALMPVLVLYLLWRSRKQPEYRLHWGERFGWSLPHTAPGAIWIHAVSLGETLAVESLVQALRLRYPHLPLLLTHTTPTGRAAGLRLSAQVAGLEVRYLPYDTPGSMRRFVAALKPCVGLLMETEVWPNLVAACKQAGVPLALINGRLSEKSLARGLSYAALAREALQGLSLVLTQTPEDARRLALLGASAPQTLGNLKFDISPRPALLEQGRRWRRDIGHRKVLLLANTREGEESLFLEAMKAAKPEAWMVLLVPRHPQRFDEVAREIAQAGWRFVRRSQVLSMGSVGTDSRPVADGGGLLGATRPVTPEGLALHEAQVILGDSLGEMPAYYAAADLCIMGGSFAPLGGHNLIEACACACPVILGPHTFNFALASEQAIAAGAAWRVENAGEAFTLAQRLLDGDLNAARLNALSACSGFARMHQGATERTLAALSPLLPSVLPSVLPQ